MYVLAQVYIVTTFVAQHSHIKDQCEECKNVGIYGAIINCLSDYMLIINFGLKKYE